MAECERMPETFCLPDGTLRWLIQQDGNSELLVIDATLLPSHLSQFAKHVVWSYALDCDDKVQSIEDILSYPDKDPGWKLGGWKTYALFPDAVLARVPSGRHKQIWAAAHNGNKTSRIRALSLSLCLACAVLSPQARSLQKKSQIDEVLCHRDFNALVNAAERELKRARDHHLQHVQQRQALSPPPLHAPMCPPPPPHQSHDAPGKASVPSVAGAAPKSRGIKHEPSEDQIKVEPVQHSPTIEAKAEPSESQPPGWSLRQKLKDSEPGDAAGNSEEEEMPAASEADSSESRNRHLMARLLEQAREAEDKSEELMAAQCEPRQTRRRRSSYDCAVSAVDDVNRLRAELCDEHRRFEQSQQDLLRSRKGMVHFARVQGERETEAARKAEAPLEAELAQARSEMADCHASAVRGKVAEKTLADIMRQRIDLEAQTEIAEAEAQQLRHLLSNAEAACRTKTVAQSEFHRDLLNSEESACRAKVDSELQKWRASLTSEEQSCQRFEAVVHYVHGSGDFVIGILNLASLYTHNYQWLC
jgi:hypothetical protein